MLYVFAAHPTWWLYPALGVLVIWILLARLIPPFDGEGNKIFREPGIIVCGSLLWFITVPFIVMGTAIFALAALVGLMVKKSE